MPPPHLITLDVSGRIYKTSKATLLTSPYFTNLFTRWDECADLQEDGSYFIDADADVFEHVLAFMRRPTKFPLHWSHEHGFDYALYNNIEAEADFFLLHDLRDWVRRKRYHHAVKTVVEVRVMAEDEATNVGVLGSNRDGYREHVEVQSFFGSYSGERRVRSPCALHAEDSRGYVKGCGGCEALGSEYGVQFDEAQKKLTMVIKRIVFDKRVCSNEGTDA
jgi:hypothetical protein